MTYIQSQTSHQRIGILTGVAVLHVALGYALVTGLAAKFKPFIETVIQAENIPAEQPLPEPPPPPPEVEKSVIINTPQVVPEGAFTLGDTSSLADDIFIPPYQPPAPLPPLQSGPVLPKADPIMAKPRNDPGSWATEADYPSRPYRMGIEGTVRFAVTVGTNGRVESCRVTGTSGNADLDAATCRLVTRNARFEAARDADGAKVPGEYANAVRWMITE